MLRPGPRFARELEVAAIALLAALAVGSAVMLVTGAAPGSVWWAMLERTFSSEHLTGQLLFKATGLALCGLAVALALDAGLFNLGVVAQLDAGILACAVVGAALPAGTPALVAVPLCLLAAAAGGAAIGALIGSLRAYRGAHEVLSSIMLNSIVAGLALWIGTSLVFLPGETRGPEIVAGAQLPPLPLEGSSANLAFGFALAAAGIVWWLRARTTWGRAWRAVGENLETARTVGIPVARAQVLVMIGAGALAGIGATNFVMGYKHAFEEGLGRGTGILGISAALLGRAHPAGVVVASLVLAFLSTGGIAVQDLVPKELTEMLQGVVVVAVAAAGPLVARRAAAEERAR